jgi:arsenate reductase (thioredoxin)
VVLPYEDPKHADGTPDEWPAYDERRRQIAAEMLYLLSRVAG